MARTGVGNFPIGLRPKGGSWTQDLPAVIDFAIANGFEALDLPDVDPPRLAELAQRGLRIASVDLKRQWSDLLSLDASKRKASIEANVALIQAAVPLGVRQFFCVAIPEEPITPRPTSFALAVESFRRLAEAIAPLGARVVIEGWPGRPPHYSSLLCTPADCRAFFEAVKSDAVGFNYDPSHLVRTGIDPIRFLREFASRVYHVHAKDTLLLPDEQYEHGTLQPATFAKPHVYGQHAWRYTIPGAGVIDWHGLLQTLVDLGYEGVVSIELEDEHYHGSEAAEKRGVLIARDFLAST